MTEGRKDERFNYLQDDQMLVFMQYSKTNECTVFENLLNFTKLIGFYLSLHGCSLETVNNLMKSPCKMKVNLCLSG